MKSTSKYRAVRHKYKANNLHSDRLKPYFAVDLDSRTKKYNPGVKPLNLDFNKNYYSTQPGNANSKEGLKKFHFLGIPIKSEISEFIKLSWKKVNAPIKKIVERMVKWFRNLKPNA